MRILSEHLNIGSLPQPNVVRLVASNEMPRLDLVTAALALAFSDEGFLMTNLRSRGWDIPGGHIVHGESPQTTVIREVQEETGVLIVPIALFAHQWIHIEGETPKDYPYPVPDSYQVFFLARPALNSGPVAGEEVLDARFWPIDEAHASKWVRENRPLFEEALVQWKAL